MRTLPTPTTEIRTEQAASRQRATSPLVTASLPPGRIAALGRSLDLAGMDIDPAEAGEIARSSSALQQYAARFGLTEGDDALTGLLTALLVAGASTWPATVTAAARHLAEAGTIQETLRSHSPLHGLYRRATQDTQLGGLRVAEDTLVLLMWRAATKEGRYSAFGIGPHRCPAQALVERTASMVLERTRASGLVLQTVAPPQPLRVMHFEPQPICRVAAIARSGERL